MLDVFLLRHGHCADEPGRPLTPETPLSPLGRQMAQRLADRCQQLGIDQLLASPMVRAQETADAISWRLPDVARSVAPAFAEVALPDLDGYAQTLPEDDLMQWRSEHFAYANQHMWQRAAEGWGALVADIERLAGENGHGRVAIVSHAGPINALIRHFMGQGPVMLRTCWMTVDWCSVSCLGVDPQGQWGTRWVRWVNDTRHLEGLLPTARS
jgi:probable phosphoglycerate mutase